MHASCKAECDAFALPRDFEAGLEGWWVPPSAAAPELRRTGGAAGPPVCACRVPGQGSSPTSSRASQKIARAEKTGQGMQAFQASCWPVVGGLLCGKTSTSWLGSPALNVSKVLQEFSRIVPAQQYCPPLHTEVRACAMCGWCGIDELLLYATRLSVWPFRFFSVPPLL